MNTRIVRDDVRQLLDEHRALAGHFGEVQRLCSEQLRAQAGEIERLRAQAMRLRAVVMVRETALAWAREDRAVLESTIPGLPPRATLARRVEALLARAQDLLRERLQCQRPMTPRLPLPEAGPPGDGARADAGARTPDHFVELEAHLVTADLVICQTGCLSHGEYWRVQDHCRRTGKACVLVEQPDAVRIVRLHKPGDDEIVARAATVNQETPP